MRRPEILTPILATAALWLAGHQLSGCNSAPVPPRESNESKVVSAKIDTERGQVKGWAAKAAIVEDGLEKLLDEPVATLPVSSPEGAGICIAPSDAIEESPDPPNTAEPLKPVKKPPILETAKNGEALTGILKAYEYVLGPDRRRREFYYIDIVRLFKPYGPFPDDEDRADRGNFHDENRRAIAAKDPRAHIDIYRDLPVPAAAGVPGQRFERKYQRAMSDYKGRPLIDQFGDQFDRHYNKSQLKKLLKESGQEDYFRDLVLYGLIGVESGWNPQMQTYAGRDGGVSIYAKGLAQAVDHTQRHMERKGKLKKGLNPFVPEDAAQYCVALLENNLQYLIEAVGKDSFLFQGENIRSLTIPLLLTSYNQGHGRLVRMAEYFIKLHDNGTIPEEYYLDQSPNFTSDTIVWFFARAFTNVRTGRTPKGASFADAQFRANNGGFGPDGAQYALKVIALHNNFLQALGTKPN